jgi:hypothetical protein
MRREGEAVRIGVVLLECLVALSLLGVAIVSVSPFMADLMRTPYRAVVADETLEKGDQLLSAISLWSRHELDLRLGVRRQGPFLVGIHRVGEELYHVSVSTGRAHLPLLSTRLMRLSTETQK